MTLQLGLFHPTPQPVQVALAVVGFRWLQTAHDGGVLLPHVLRLPVFDLYGGLSSLDEAQLQSGNHVQESNFGSRFESSFWIVVCASTISDSHFGFRIDRYPSLSVQGSGW